MFMGTHINLNHQAEILKVGNCFIHLYKCQKSRRTSYKVYILQVLIIEIEIPVLKR